MSLSVERLRALISEDIFWREVLVQESVGSTNDLLKERAQAGAPEGSVFIAEEQTSGKGRHGRSWHSPKGGAWFSVLLRPHLAVADAGCVGVSLAIGLAEALRKSYQLPIGVKWPNDLWLNGRKIAGILVELASRGEKIEWMVAGIGLNVNNALPSETRVPATSLALALGRPLILEEFYHLALMGLAESYLSLLRRGFGPIQVRWKALSILGESVEVQHGDRRYQARVLGLSDSGKLLVRAGQDLRELAAEEVSLTI
jgi:BirA family biotin operon repressor/biotin-[acetyl-CoA-carboxylase] ligase